MNNRNHCRFRNCVPTKVTEERNIKSAYHFNLKELSGRRHGCLQDLWSQWQSPGCLLYRRWIKLLQFFGHR
ncbi:uncharacterized protein BDV17DRAFT_254400 [Aspergillus undulatus]|uniref:uncharacterized protein n=1 Tax=Aspergillus undulatus TaxID=1810928 RepID=UPI003CCDA003